MKLGTLGNFTVWAAVPMFAALAAGCSGTEGKIYDAYKCAKVATMLGRGGQAQTASLKIKPYLDELERQDVNQSQYLMSLQTKFTDDLALYKLSPAGQGKAILDAYESGTCQKLYRP